MEEYILILKKSADSDNEIDETPAPDEGRSKLSKIHLPKRKYAIIHGYIGHKFSGNQK